MTLPKTNRRPAAACGTMAAILLGHALVPAAAAAQTTAIPPPVVSTTATSAVPEAEEAYTEKMVPPLPQWGFVRGREGTSVFDGTTGKMRGTVDTSPSSDMAIDPAGRYYYVSETIWTKGWRGKRQDMVSIYDSVDMKLQAEIPMPGRLIIGGRKQNFVVSDDGRTAFVYNMNPATSVNVIDLAARKFVRAVELPGCASLMPVAGVGFAALCSDGTLATVTAFSAKPQITRSQPFFRATEDPIYDNFAYDRAKSEATFITYTGMIYQAKIGATPVIGQPWSIQAAAGLRPGDTRPLDVNWLPGGTSPMALHRASGHLFVLMHTGEIWSTKEGGTEVWDVDLAAHKVVRRMPIDTPAVNIEVTQDANPMLFLNARKGDLWIYDAKTYTQKYKVENGGGGVIATIDPR